MKDSIIQSKEYQDTDLFDTGSKAVQRHHVMFGFRRDKSDEDGLWVSLTDQHHEHGENPRLIPGRICSVHGCRYMRELLCMLGQMAWEKQWYRDRCTDMTGDPARDEFLKRYGKRYL